MYANKTGGQGKGSVPITDAGTAKPTGLGQQLGQQPQEVKVGVPRTPRNFATSVLSQHTLLPYDDDVLI